jgi:hypothetical protein
LEDRVQPGPCRGMERTPEMTTHALPRYQRRLLPISMLLIVTSIITAATLTGKVVGIADGDTLTLLVAKIQIKSRHFPRNCRETASTRCVNPARLPSYGLLPEATTKKTCSSSNGFHPDSGKGEASIVFCRLCSARIRSRLTADGQHGLVQHQDSCQVSRLRMSIRRYKRHCGSLQSFHSRSRSAPSRPAPYGNRPVRACRDSLACLAWLDYPPLVDPGRCEVHPKVSRECVPEDRLQPGSFRGNTPDDQTATTMPAATAGHLSAGHRHLGRRSPNTHWQGGRHR